MREGWKPYIAFQKGTENQAAVLRWWSGHQWTDSYKDKEDTNAEARPDSEAQEVLFSHGPGKEDSAGSGILPEQALASHRPESQGLGQATRPQQDGSEDSSAAKGKQQVKGGKPITLPKNVKARKYIDGVSTPEAVFEDTSGYGLNPNRHTDAAKLYVIGANAAYVADIPGITPEQQNEQELTVDQLYVVMFSYVLGSWKALISTSVAGDGLYFEVTHNEAKQESYVDIYKKQANHVFSHHDH